MSFPRRLLAGYSPVIFHSQRQLHCTLRSYAPTNTAKYFYSTTESGTKFQTYKNMMETKTTMKGLVYTGPDTIAVQERPIPRISAPTDVIVKMQHTTICGSDLHILKGDVPTAEHGRILGHEGVGVIASLGSAVDAFYEGDIVLISCITACGICPSCRKGLKSHCESGGWILGNIVDGTQAEYVRIPHAASSLYKIPGIVDSRTAVTLSDAFPTGLECGTLNAHVQPGSTVAIVGAGPVGLAAMMTAKMYSPSLVVVIDKDETRLKHAKERGADSTINPDAPDAMATLDTLTEEKGFDSVIEAVGLPATFELCQRLVAPGGAIANVGVHGQKVDLFLDKLWDRNISIKTRLVDTDTIPMLLQLSKSGTIRPSSLITHHFSFSDIIKAYDSFRSASRNGTLKVAIDFP